MCKRHPQTLIQAAKGFEPAYNCGCVLQEFVTHEKWMHLDIAGVMGNKSEVSYLGKGMSGMFSFNYSFNYCEAARTLGHIDLLI